MRRQTGCLGNLVLLGFLGIATLVVYFTFFADQPVANWLPRSPVPAVKTEQPPQPAPGRLPPSTQPTEEGRMLVSALLKQLDAFKANRRFHEMGFGQGANFQPWMERAQAGQNNERYSLAERAAFGALITMAMEYQRTGGAENEVTRTLREDVEQASESR